MKNKLDQSQKHFSGDAVSSPHPAPERVWVAISSLLRGYGYTYLSNDDDAGDLVEYVRADVRTEIPSQPTDPPHPAREACAKLWEVLREVNVAATIGYKKGVLHVAVADLGLDAPHVPPEFMGFKTRVHQDSDHTQFAHKKVASDGKTGCVHTAWEERQFITKGIIPNPNCPHTQRN